MSNGVSVAGTMQNILHLGFTNSDAICEGIDNSLDSHATEIHIIFNKESRMYVHVDNGNGILPEELPDAYCMNNRKQNNTQTHGKFGIGANALGIILSELEGGMTVVTKDSSADNNCDMHMNFEQTISSGIFNRTVNVVDVDGTDNRSTNGNRLWNEFTNVTNNNTGTILQIKCSQRVANEISDMIDTRKLHDILGKQYYTQILQHHVAIFVNGDIVNAIDYLDRENTEHVITKTYPIRMIDDIPRVCSFRTGRNGDIKDVGFSESRKKWFDLSDEEKSVEPIGEIKITSAFDPTWTSNAHIGFGGLYIVREFKMVKYFASDKENSGDHKVRPIIEAARHQIEFESVLDDIFGVLVNKSDLRKDMMNPHILTFITYITRDYTKGLYKDHYKTQSHTSIVDGETIPSQINDIVDNIYANNAEVTEIVNESSTDESDNEHTNTIRHHIVSPPMVVLELRFSIENRSRILSIEDEQTNRVIARANTYGEGSGFRKWCCGMLREKGRESFIEFISTTPTIFECSNVVEYSSAI